MEKNQTKKKCLLKKAPPATKKDKLDQPPQKRGPPATEQGPGKAAQYIRLRSTRIESGVAKIAIRNNNPFPVRNISLVVKCLPAFRSNSERPVHTFNWFVEDLIMPGTDYLVEAFDAKNTKALVGHEGTATDAWIPAAEVLRLEAVKP